MAADEPARRQRPLAEASEEVWRRRAETRRTIVAAIKDSLDYRALQASRRPGTPDPNDRMTSKRSWETKVMQWRNALNELSQLEKETAQLLIDLETKKMQRRNALKDLSQLEKEKAQLLIAIETKKMQWRNALPQPRR